MDHFTFGICYGIITAVATAEVTEVTSSGFFWGIQKATQGEFTCYNRNVLMEVKVIYPDLAEKAFKMNNIDPQWNIIY